MSYITKAFYPGEPEPFIERLFDVVLPVTALGRLESYINAEGLNTERPCVIRVYEVDRTAGFLAGKPFYYTGGQPVYYPQTLDNL